MKAIVCAMIGIFMYAGQNILLDEKLKEQPIFSLLFCSYLVMLPLSFVGMWFNDGDKNIFHTGNQQVLFWAIISGVFLFLADFSYISAYTYGKGDAVTVTTIAITLPVIVSVIKYMTIHTIPNFYQISGYILFACAVVLVAKGSQ